MTDRTVSVVGGGLAGSEAAWMLACRGIPVTLYEMRPQATTPAHRTDGLAEVVCSNSFGADSTTSPAGILKEELRGLGSLILKCADAARVPAGKALAVDRDIFSRLVTETLESHPLVTVVREERLSVPEGPVILATGPLTAWRRRYGRWPEKSTFPSSTPSPLWWRPIPST
jgi:methylenetetrahydrofolate--tRNA-(uracil-5-)-methyltransferase